MKLRSSIKLSMDFTWFVPVYYGIIRNVSFSVRSQNRVAELALCTPYRDHVELTAVFFSVQGNC